MLPSPAYSKIYKYILKNIFELDWLTNGDAAWKKDPKDTWTNIYFLKNE